MSPAFTIDNIDRMRAIALNTPNRWKIVFRSTNIGLHHQLYVNGDLSDWTDTCDQRSFVIDADAFPKELVIAAVDPYNRDLDMSAQLPLEVQEPTWIYRALQVSSPKYRPGSQVAILSDHATGNIDTLPLAIRKLRPEWLWSWGFAEDPFGMGGLGYDANTAPGIGRGTFGAGDFGIDAKSISISAALVEEGTHQILLRVISESGEYTDGSIQYINVFPPPPPPTSLTTTNYQPETSTLTLQIQ